MNIHHLELFYYVARHGGISGAVRNIPYGIQQPAVSGQILQLEDFLGATLFVRPPFALTPTGRDLYQFIQPFFDHLPLMSERIRGNGAQPVRIAATSVILRDHLPANEGVAKHFQAGLMEAFLEALQRRAQQLLVDRRGPEGG